MNVFARARSDDAAKLILRLTVAIVVLFHGVWKLQNGIAWMAEPLGELGLPAFLAYGVYVAEVVAPIMLIVGWQVQLAALVIVIDMIMAVVLVLGPQLFTIRESGGGWGIELEALIFGGALATFFLGAGRFSIDGRST
jgi:putative oxidoreductase